MEGWLNPLLLWQRLRWEWLRHQFRLPWMAGLSLFLLMAALAAGVAAWSHWSGQNAPAIVQAAPRVRVELTPEAQARVDLDHFYAGLPPAHSLSVPLIALLRLGEKHHLHFTQGEYHLLADGDSRVQREDIVLPAEASPADIQDFLHDALQSLRALTVSGIAFEREDARASIVKARIHFVLMARAS